MDINLYNNLVNKLETEAKNGNVEAMVDLADLLYQGPNMDEQNLIRAIPYYIMAADSDNVYSMCKSGLALLYGMADVPQDIEKSLYYLDKAAHEGMTEIQCHLGSCYENGTPFEKDLKKALYYYNMAASKNDPNGLYGLSRVKALLDCDDWFTDLCKAHVLGCKEATEMLDDMVATHGQEAYDDIQNEIAQIKTAL